ETNDRDIAGGGANLVADQLLRCMLAGELGHGKTGSAQAIRTMQMAAIGVWDVVGCGCCPQARVTGGVALLDDGLDVERGPFRGDITRDGVDSDDLQAGVEECQREGQRVVDSWIAVDNHFAGHESILGVRKTGHKADSRIRRQRTGDRRQSVIESYLGRVVAGEDLSAEAMEEIVGLLLDGKVPENEIAVLLTGLKH